MARVTGLEPATSGVTGRRSNQLSYTRFFSGTAFRVVVGGLIAAFSGLATPLSEKNVISCIFSDFQKKKQPKIAIPEPRKITSPSKK